MKKIIALLSLVVVIAFVFSACASQHKCPAYGHYTQNVTVDESTLASK